MFDYITNIRSHNAIPCTWDIMETVMKSVAVTSTCAEIADLREKKLRGEMSREDFDTKKAELKKRLPAFCFHAHFKNGRRLNDDAVPSGLSLLDIDHIPSPEVFFNEKVKDRCKELNIVLAHKTPSGEGLRLVFVIPNGKNLVEGQKWLASQIGLEKFDEACKDLARCSFAVPYDYVLFIDKDELFKDRSVAAPNDASTEKCALAGEGLVPSLKKGQDIVEGRHETDPCKASEAEQSSGNRSDTDHGVVITKDNSSCNDAEVSVATNETLKIFDDSVREAGLDPETIDKLGNRHNSLTATLSVGICRLLSKEQLMAAIATRMPEYAKGSNCKQLVDDFYEKYTDNNRPMSSKLRKIYTDSLRGAAALSGNSTKGKRSGNVAEGSDATNEDIDNEKQQDDEVRQQALIKRILKKLPQGLKESVEGVPDNMQMPVLCSVLPLAAAYADGVTVRYCDGATQRLGLMSIIVGPQASGKSACKKKVDLWERQMKDEDARAREIEDQWKEAKKSKKANEKSPEDPMVLIRSVPATISCSTLLRRFKNSRGHCLWTFCEELDTLRKTNGAGSWSSKYDIYRLGFDYGEWGQDYNSDQAVSGVVNVAYNFSILGTYGALRKCFRGDNVENGLSSRIIIAEMPDSAFAPMPTYGQTTTDASSAIDKAVTLLRSQTGFVDTPRLRKAIGNWVEAKRLEAMADGDLVKDTYRKRAAVIGFRCGVVARLLTGKESNAVTEFATMMAQYVLDEQMKIFGNSLKDEYLKASEEQRRSSVNANLFDFLPPVFTLQDIRQQKGPDTSNHQLSVIISRWKHSSWIKKIGVNQWKKLTAN